MKYEQIKTMIIRAALLQDACIAAKDWTGTMKYTGIALRLIRYASNKIAV